MTDEQLFLTWCKKHKIEPRRIEKDGFHHHYALDHQTTICVGTAKLKCNKTQAPYLTVLFNPDGLYAGGSSIIWNRRLPWQRSKS